MGSQAGGGLGAQCCGTAQGKAAAAAVEDAGAAAAAAAAVVVAAKPAESRRSMK